MAYPDFCTLYYTIGGSKAGNQVVLKRRGFKPSFPIADRTPIVVTPDRPGQLAS
ncbi:MAG: hypothetical protein HC849_24380 [Oscillatoriales cyanobacterium RU_3_3]|nr:hypothetical protein [Oscillatoriales cyanobacterium RU_3_3]